MSADSALDAEIAEFAADQDRTFSEAFYAQPMAEQQAGYEALWRRFNAPRPEQVTAEDVSLDLLERRLALRIYRPIGTPRPQPVIVYFHGGSWMFGDLDSHDMAVSRLAAIAGAAVVAVDYRLAPEHKFPAALVDAWEALNWVFAEADGCGFDKSRLAVAGDSAGGALAAGMALLARDRRNLVLRAQGLIYPALRPYRAEKVAFSPGLDQAALTGALASYFARPEDAHDPYGMPLMGTNFTNLAPAVICAAELDVLLPDAKDYAVSLRSAGGSAHLIMGKGLPHTFLRALHLCSAASAAFEAFGQELGRLLRR